MNGGSACPNCGLPTSPGQRFCKECGAPVPPSAQAPPPQMAPGAPPQVAPGVVPPPVTYAARPQLSLSSLPLAEILVAVCSLIVMILSLQSWYELADQYSGEAYASMKAWPQWLVFAFSLPLLLFCLVMMINKYIQIMPDINYSMVYIAAGVLILVFTILPTFIKPTKFTFMGESTEIFSWDILRMKWAYFIVTLIFTLGIIAGGILKAREQTW